MPAASVATGRSETQPATSVESDRSPPLLAVALLSSAALAYEVLLTRLFAIIQWHHFAYMMISVALLGYGAAGTLVALSRQALLQRYTQAFAAGAIAFGVSAVAGFALAERVAFNPLEIPWDPGQTLRLVAIYALLFVPFFCVATCICMTFTRFAAQPHRIYSYDILGAGAGSLAIIGVLFVLAPPDALRVIGAAGLAAAAMGLVGSGARGARAAVGLAVIALVLPAAIPSEWIALRPSEYKELSQALRIGGARIVAERSSPLGSITVVENRQVPFRHAPGMSLNATMEPPAQLAVFTDGDALSALARWDGRRETLGYLDQLTSALPYHLLERPKVLVLGAGAGADVLQALGHDARAIDAVELNGQIVDLVRSTFAAYAGAPYAARGVAVHVGEARGFVTARRERYDLIHVALLDAFNAASAGLYALSESYLYTVEALQQYVRHLTPGGMLSLTRWINLPPKDMLKLVAMAAVALEREGGAPARQIALVRSWKTATLVVKNGAFSATDVAAVREFCRTRSFDVVYLPGIDAQETNRFNVLDRPDFHEGALALVDPGRDAFIARYKFDIAPATDDRPYFLHFFRWRTLPELLALKERGGLPLLDWGYPVLVATLVQAVALSLLLVVVPLAIAARRGASTAVRRAPVSRVAAYFAAIGFAFMFVEMAFIQKFLLLLAHPLYAIAVVLCSFLLFAGLGSRYSQRFAANDPRSLRMLVRIVTAIAALSVAYVFTLPLLFAELIALAAPLRVALSIALIAPLAFAMGMPLPLGLARTAERDASLVPWAWAINGCASVVAAVLATLVAVHFGFGAVIAVAVLLYALAAAGQP